MGDIGNGITEPGEPLGLTRPDWSALPGSQTTNPAPSPAETRMEGRRGARGLGQSVRFPRLRVDGRTDFSSAELGVRGSALLCPLCSATISRHLRPVLIPVWHQDSRMREKEQALGVWSIHSADRTFAKAPAPPRGAAPWGPQTGRLRRAQLPEACAASSPPAPSPSGGRGPRALSVRSRWDVLREAARVPAATFPRENVRIL